MSLGEAEQVKMALDLRAMGALFERQFGAELPQPAHMNGRVVAPVCRIMDLKYEPGDYCLILYRLNGQYVIGSFGWGGEASTATDARTRIIEPLGMEAYLFPYDPALPGLPTAIDPRSVKEALRDFLPELGLAGAEILRCQVNVLRFRPGKRCTARLDLRLRKPESSEVFSQTLYAKIYHRRDKALAAFQEMRLLSSSTPAREGRVAFADSPAWIPELLMVLQSPVSGAPLEVYLECTPHAHPLAAEGIRRSGAALALVHTAGLRAGRERPIEKELVRFHKRAQKIGLVNPQLAEQIDQVTDCAEELFPRLAAWGAEITLVHGDCKPSQFLLREDGSVAVLDFDHCGMADPAGDVGTYLATLQQMLVLDAYRNRGHAPLCHDWVLELKQQFLDIYCATAHFAEDFRRRTAWYEGVALLRKTIRSFERGPFSPVPALLVTEARQILGTIPS